MRCPQGFTFSGVASGLKPSRRDLALVVSDGPCAAAGRFTINKAKAAPILEAQGRLPSATLRAVVLNSGNANALTGEAGVEDVRQVNAAVAKALGCAPEAVVAASTGVIGVRLPVAKVLAALPALVKELKPHPEGAAEAILTTDTRPKLAFRTLRLGEQEVVLSAICKGSGMIAPQLATMLAVIVTDCDISPQLLDAALTLAMPTSFHCLTIDNEMSTNDSVLALANGRARNRRIDGRGPDFDAFAGALQSLCEELAREIATDGEGATKLVEVRVGGAPSAEIAQDLAKAIAGSPLVKAAVFGADPNWGRVLATVGARCGAGRYPVDPLSAKVVIQDVTVFDKGPVAHESTLLRQKMRAPEVHVEVELGQGAAAATAWGCDLSYDYVKINADYTSLIVQNPDGGMAKDDRLTNYSPKFKMSLLVQALSYISKFTGRRCVIKYGGAAMIKDSLKLAFCNDVNLLRSVGLRPIVVHGSGPEITRALEKLGTKTKYVDGVRVTNASDLKVVEMVMSGSINSEIVTLLNREGGHAVGVSGKDGGLLKARKLVSEQGKDLGQVGEITQVNKGFLEMLLGQDYVPVISPIGMGDDGQSYNLNADQAAAEVAVAVGASKLIFLADVAGILEKSDLISELPKEVLAQKLEEGAITGGMRTKARSMLRALQGGVEQVHVIDGRTPHSMIAELFTDNGIGTLVR